jgi:hypothetical protein
LDIGVIDVETCKPAPNVLVDIWLANATGHYSGKLLSCLQVVMYLTKPKATPIPHRTLLMSIPKSAASAAACSPLFHERRTTRPSSVARGPPTGTASRSLHVRPFLRASFNPFLEMLIQSNIRTAIFPGYYTGRATHIHTKVFPKWTVHPENGTFTPGRLAHVGQFFFEDDINMAVDKVCLSLPSVLPSFSPSLSFTSFLG